MASVTTCPQCRQSLGVPTPPPARVRCPKCSTIFSPAAPAPVSAGPPPVAAVAGAAAGAGAISAVPLPWSAAGDRPVPVAKFADDSAPASIRTKRALLVGAGVVTVLVLCMILIWKVAGGRNRGGTGPGSDINLGSHSGSAANHQVTQRPLEEQARKVVELGKRYLHREIKKARTGLPFHLGTSVEPGRIALAALTLLECEVPASDPDIRVAADYVRAFADKMQTTYTVAPAILLLDRLNKGKTPSENDRHIIRMLTLRLIAGQTKPDNLWSYKLPILDDAAETKAISQMRKGELYEGPANITAQPPDLSNAQFAALALWAARRHKLPVDAALRAAADSIRKHQLADGSWPYHVTAEKEEANKDTGTCVGLILLALGHGVRDGGPGAKFMEDEAVKKAVARLAVAVKRPDNGTIARPQLVDRFESKGGLYFLWTLERTVLILDLPMIGEKSWHHWHKMGTDIVVAHQKPERDKDGDWGFWAETHLGLADTCFALLFLVQADLFRDLTDKLLQAAIIERLPEGLANVPRSPGRRPS